jgi:hypothetical protein|tara:strand:- start:350 stop:496 length:147 start_codon:yes stop_codon:yes gene_type:complete
MAGKDWPDPDWHHGDLDWVDDEYDLQEEEKESFVKEISSKGNIVDKKV